MKTIYHDDTPAIQALLVGRSVREVDEDTLTLDDGTKLKIVPNEGGCICGAGDYELDYLGKVPNVITAAEVAVETDSPEKYVDVTTYRIFVYAEGVQHELARVVGDDGNGYYGTGFSIDVTKGT